jgi:regulator of cell morphogenesis and NO signaling
MNARLETSQLENFSLTSQHALGQIAVRLPGATAVFRRLKLDFCCGGQISLEQAARDKGLDLQAVLAELGALQHPQEVPTLTDPAEQIDHILTRYHEVHRQQLPELVRMARRVEAVHRDNAEVPAGLAALLEGMEVELLGHMIKEEEIVFPAIRSGGQFVAEHIAMLRGEHVEHGARLDGVLALTNSATPPAGACNTWRALYAGIAQLNDDLINHIHLENNILFAHFDAPAAPKSGCGANGGGCGCSGG